MTDFADKASERQAELEADALAMRKPEGPKATGYCLECGEDLWLARAEPTGEVHPEFGALYAPCMRRWCNAQCRDEWERKNS